MKNFEYKFIYNDSDLRYIKTHIQFNEKKKEREIFQLLLKGYTCNEISDKTGICARTVMRRRKEIYYRIQNSLSTRNIITDSKQNGSTITNNNRVFCVYVLIFPNHKMYVGQSRDPYTRWNNGQGYKDNIEMYNDILYYGWCNILKSIPYKNLSYNEAISWEEHLTVLYDTCNPNKGYNKRVGNGGKE